MAETFMPDKEDRFQVSFIDLQTFWLIDTKGVLENQKCHTRSLSTFHKDYMECVDIALRIERYRESV